MEIEIRSFIEDFDGVRERLLAMKAEKLEETDIKDIWYCPNDAESFEDVQMDKKGSIGIRLRHEKGKRPEINIKTIVTENDHNVFDEVETNFDSIEHMKKMLRLLGFKPFCRIVKHRETYGIDTMKINLENIEGFPPCIEVEIIDDKDYDENLEKIENLMAELEIPQDKRIEKSITNLFMHENSFKQEIER